MQRRIVPWQRHVDWVEPEIRSDVLSIVDTFEFPSNDYNQRRTAGRLTLFDVPRDVLREDKVDKIRVRLEVYAERVQRALIPAVRGSRRWLPRRHDELLDSARGQTA